MGNKNKRPRTLLLALIMLPALVQEGAILATDVSTSGGHHERATLICIGDTVNGYTVSAPSLEWLPLLLE